MSDAAEPGAVTVVTDADFEEKVLKADKPVVVDFWAEWCQPCLRLAKTLGEVAAEKAGEVTVVKIDVDANPDTAATYNIRSLPTLILFKDGKPAATHSGDAPKSRLEAFISGGA